LSEKHSPLDQFTIHRIFEMKLGGIDISLTNSSLMMIIVLIVLNIFLIYSTKKKSISHKKFLNGFKKESLISINFLLIIIAYQLVSITSQAILIKFLILILIGIFLSYSIPNLLGNKIGGFNGDACGASVVLVETAMLFMHAILL